MNGLRIFGVLGSTIAFSVLTACASPPKAVPVVVDWTNRACESPAYGNILGNYVGQINYRGGDTRSCRWNTQISIIGISMVADCNLTGTITATPEVAAGDGYQCSDIEAQTKFVVGLSDADLNRFGPSSVIVHFEEELPTMTNGGKVIVSPIVQFEALTAENGTLVNSSGNVLSRQYQTVSE